jgi:hypothetical protein
VRLDQATEQDGHQFWPFGSDLELKEVVAGSRCDVTQDELRHSLGDRAGQVALTKARPAFTKFEIVTQQQGFPKSRNRRTSQCSGPEARVARPGR